MVYDVNVFYLEPTKDIDWVAIAAVAISIIALFVTLWQTHVARKHNKLSVLPHLGAYTFDTGEVFTHAIRNSGLGPAWITATRLYLNGKLVEGKGPSLISKAFEGIKDCELQAHEFFTPGFVLPAGEAFKVCTVRYKSSVGDVQAYLANQLYLEIEYKTAYGDVCPMYTSDKD